MVNTHQHSARTSPHSLAERSLPSVHSALSASSLTSVAPLCAISVLFVAVLLVMMSALVPIVAYADSSVNAETYSIRNPKITVNYTDPVFLVQKSLIALDPANPTPNYPVCQLPKQEDASYVKSYTLYTRDNADPSTCEGTAVYLTPGRYQLTLEAIDPTGQMTMPNAIDIKEFIISGIEIKLADPVYGIANHHPYDIIFTTNNDSICRYSFTNKPFEQMTATQEGATAGKNHNLRNIDYRGDLFIICEEPSKRQTPAKFIIGWDATPPRITPLAMPARVIDPRAKYAGITVSTDDNASCTIDDQPFNGEDATKPYTYNTTHGFVQFYNEITDTAEHNFTHMIACKNLAQLKNITTLNVTVNFGEFVFIDVLDPPERYNQQTFTLRVKPTFLADGGCEVNKHTMTEDSSEPNVFTYDISASEGKNVFNLNCTGAKNSTRQYNVTIDTIPPVTPTLNASNKLCANSIFAKWNTSERSSILSYTYKVSDAKGTIGDGETMLEQVTVPLTRSISGTLHWEVFATDFNGNNATPAIDDIVSLEEGSDEECGLPPFITINGPNMGFSRTKPYTLSISTLRESECRYSLLQGTAWAGMSAFVSEDQLTHTKSGLTFPDARIYVVCNETDGTLHRKTIHVGIDATAPRIAALTEPNPVIDPQQKIVLVTVTSDDDTYCTHNSTDGPQFTKLPDSYQDAYLKEHTTLFDYRGITSTVEQRRVIAVTCKNLATQEAKTKFTIVIDLGAKLKINVLSPSKYTADSSITLRVKPSKLATCTWQNSSDGATPSEFSTVDTINNTHTQELGALSDGGYSYTVQCMAADGQATTVAQFVVDRTAPGIIDLAGPSVICPAVPATYHYNITGLDQKPIISYSLEGAGGSGASFQDNTTDALITLSVTGIDPGDYTLKLIPINKANVSGQPASMSVSIKGRTDESCLQPTNHCTNKRIDPGEEGTDCGGTCPTICISCATSESCPTGMACIEGYCVDSGACVDDSTCELGQQCVNGDCETVACTSNNDCTESTICVQGVCVIPPSCATDADCSEGYSCVSNVCVLPACGNKMKDEGETGVDCGGICPACISCLSTASGTSNASVNGTAGAVTGTDCVPPTVCQSGVCVSPSCTSNLDCDDGHVCQYSACVPVQLCDLDSECSEGKTCVEHICTAPTPEGCQSDYDCNPGMQCIDGECASKSSGCTSDDDCPSGTCNVETGYCEEDPCDNGRIDAGEQNVDCGGKCAACVQCSTNDDCPSGKICDPSNNVCIPGRTTPPPETGGKSHLLSILLIVIGIAIMGGAGYFLYEQNEEKKAAASRQAAAMQAAQMAQRGRGGPAGPGAGPPRPTMDPQQLAKLRAEQAARQAAMREEFAKRAAEKNAQRSALFSGFDGLVDGPHADSVAPPESSHAKDAGARDASNTRTTIKDATVSGDDADEDYVDITSLGKKKDAKDTDTKDARSKKVNSEKGDDASVNDSSSGKKKDVSKEDEAFDELDRLGK